MKSSLRKSLLLKRDGIAPAERISKDKEIRERLFSLDVFKNAKTILFYASFRSEVGTLECIRTALELGKNTALPLVDFKKKELLLFRIKDIAELEPGYRHIPEPGIIKNRDIALGDINVVIIPGAGFDLNGNRLGYGAGYYDRLLSNTKRHISTIALAYEEQITEEIPVEPHDVQVDAIVTDKRLINCTG